MTDEVSHESTTTPETAEAEGKPKKEKDKTQWLMKHSYAAIGTGEPVTKEIKVVGPFSRAIRRSKKFLDLNAQSGTTAIRAAEDESRTETGTISKPDAASAAFHVGGKDDPSIPRPEKKEKAPKAEEAAETETADA